MARSRRRPELQREGQVRCRFCGTYYDPALPECPNCGYQTEENRGFTTDWSTVGPEDCAGGFGGSRSAIKKAAKLLSILLIALLVSAGAVAVGKNLVEKQVKTPAATGAETSAQAEPNDSENTGEQSAPAPVIIEKKDNEENESASDDGKNAEKDEKQDKTGSDPYQLTLNYTDMTLRVNEVQKLQLSVRPKYWTGDVRWSTSDQYVAWVDQDGTVTCLGGGQCFITAAAGETEVQCQIRCRGRTASHNTVEKWLREHASTEETENAKDEEDTENQEEKDRKEDKDKKDDKDEEKKEEDEDEDEEKDEKGGLTLSMKDVTLVRPGDVYTLTAKGGGGHYSWSIGNQYVATVSDGGVITAASRGTTTVTCTSEDGSTATCRVHVTKK